MKSVVLVVLILLALPFQCWAQGTITDGAASFRWNLFTINADNADYWIGDGVTHLFEDWWYFRVDGDTDESAFTQPDTQAYTGAVATLGWSDVDGLSLLDAQLVSTIFEGGNGTASYVRHQLTITNISDSSLGIHVFGYLDYDLTGSETNDQATLVTDPSHMKVFDTSTHCEFQGLAANAFQVNDTQDDDDLRGLMEDGSVTDLDGSGLPFGPGDWEGMYQWDAEIAPANSVTFTKIYTIDQPAFGVFSDGFESDDT